MKKLCYFIHLRFCSDHAVVSTVKPPFMTPYFPPRYPFWTFPILLKTGILAAATALFDQNWPSRCRGVVRIGQEEDGGGRAKGTAEALYQKNNSVK